LPKFCQNLFLFFIHFLNLWVHKNGLLKFISKHISKLAAKWPWIPQNWQPNFNLKKFVTSQNVENEPTDGTRGIPLYLCQTFLGLVHGPTGFYLKKIVFYFEIFGNKNLYLFSYTKHFVIPDSSTFWPKRIWVDVYLTYSGKMDRWRRHMLNFTLPALQRR